jgi:hypothetical protein
MWLSDQKEAGMIGAAATVGTALFQLLMAFKARGKADVKPKRGTTLRSVFAVVALMAASAAGGFLYSQLLREHEREDLRAMRQELRELRDLTTSRMLAREEEPRVVSLPNAQPADIASSLESSNGISESIAYVPACRAVANGTAECAESDAQRIALCGTIPAEARVADIKLFAQPDAVQQAWDQHGATLETDLGGARFTGKSFEYAQGQGAKAVCVNFQQWSSTHPHIARILVEYEVGEADPPQAVSIMPASHASISSDIQAVSSSGVGAVVR